MSAIVSTTVRTFTLDAEERHVLARAAAGVAGNPYEAFEPFYQSVRAMRSSLPARLRTVLTDMRDADYGGALIVDGLPLPALPPTPSEPFAKAPILDLKTEPFLVAVASTVAEPFSFVGWDAGHLVHNKYPIRSHRTVQFGSNAVEFLVHTETPFRSFSPDYIALLCLRADPTGVAKTRIGDLRAAVQTLTAAERAVLRGEYFAFETDNPAVTVDGVGLTVPRPIISDRDGREVYEYVHDLVATTPESRRVLAALKIRAEASLEDVALQHGQLLLIDNCHMIHGRTAYEPRYDGTDRWLQRLLISGRLFADGDQPPSRLVPDRQLAHYPTAYQNVLNGLRPDAPTTPANEG